MPILILENTEIDRNKNNLKFGLAVYHSAIKVCNLNNSCLLTRVVMDSRGSGERTFGIMPKWFVLL